MKIIIPLLIVVALVCILPLPTRVNKTLDGVIWDRLDAAAGTQSVSVKVNGVYLRRLLLNDSFSGHIGLSCLPETMDDGSSRMFKVVFNGNAFGGEYGYLSYYVGERNTTLSGGWLFVDGNFDSVYVSHIEGVAGCISAPASGRAEAIEVLKKTAPELGERAE